MEIRDFRRSRYVMAFVITLLIFLFGLMLGLVMEGRRIGYLEQENKVQQLDYSSLQLQYQYVDQFGQEQNCPALTTTLEKSINSLETVRINLENYNKDSVVNKNEFSLLKREYTITQLRYWLLARKTRELCQKKVAMILYFYSTKEKCPDCEEQAFVLTYLKRKFGDSLLNFAIDSNFEDEPMVSILLRTYNVSNYPTLIVNNQPYYGMTDTPTLLKEICNTVGNHTESCTQ